MLTAIAIASGGTSVGRGTVTDDTAVGRVVVRVSSSRDGVIGTNRPALAVPAETNTPDTSTTMSVAAFE
jgi:hypothetical protein